MKLALVPPWILGWVGPKPGLGALEKWGIGYLFQESNHGISVVQLAAAWSLTVATELFNLAVGSEYLTMDNL